MKKRLLTISVLQELHNFGPKLKYILTFLWNFLRKKCLFRILSQNSCAICNINGLGSKVACGRSRMDNNQFDWYIANKTTGCNISFTFGYLIL